MPKIETILRPDISSENPRVSVVMLVVLPHLSEPIRLEMGAFTMGNLHIKLISKEDVVIIDSIERIDNSKTELIIKISDLKAGEYHCIVDDDFFVQIKELKVPY